MQFDFIANLHLASADYPIVTMERIEYNTDRHCSVSYCYYERRPDDLLAVFRKSDHYLHCDTHFCPHFFCRQQSYRMSLGPMRTCLTAYRAIKRHRHGGAEACTKLPTTM